MIVVECDPDEFLIKKMGFPKKLIKHEGGKGKVLGLVKNKEIAIGIIDEDPGTNQPSEMNNYIERERKNTIKLFVNKRDERKRLIQISPFLEHWLIIRARQNRISPKDFNLPDKPKKMHDIPHIEKNRNFQKFLNELCDRDDEINTMIIRVTHLFANWP